MTSETNNPIGMTAHLDAEAIAAADHERVRTMDDTNVMTDALTDPNAVHVNMLAGHIAKPSPAQIWHIYGAELLAAMPTPDAAGIVERLSDAAWSSGGSSFTNGCVDCGLDANLCHEAAATIAAQAAELQRLREAAAGPVNQCEMPEVAAMRYIDELRQGEGDCVTILCDNPGDFDGDYNVAIDCNGGWTDWQDRRFTGESVLQCLAKAVTARNLTGAS